jgi:hypothetical protein
MTQPVSSLYIACHLGIGQNYGEESRPECDGFAAAKRKAQEELLFPSAPLH